LLRPIQRVELFGNILHHPPGHFVLNFDQKIRTGDRASEMEGGMNIGVFQPLYFGNGKHYVAIVTMEDE